MSRRPRDLLVGSLLLLAHVCWLGIAQLDSFITVTSPESGDVYLAGEVVRVEWEASQDSSYFDVNLLNDGSPVGEAFCDGGCLAPNGFLEVTLPTDLESGSLYTFLVGDRVAVTSMFGESEPFQIIAVETGTDTENDTDDDEAGVAQDETGESDGGDGDGFRWGVVIGSVAAGLGLAALCVAAVLFCCRKGRGKGKDSMTTVVGGGGSGGAHKDDSGEAGLPTGLGVSGDVFASSGGQSDSGASVAALAEIGALSPVHEENAEVVTKNPMISAMANGAQFHSSSGSKRFNSSGGGGGGGGGGGASARFNSNGSARFNSGGGSSKFPSLGGGSSNEGEGSTRGPGDEDEESEGMFADADVVAALAAAAAHGAGKKGEGTPIKRSGSGTPRWDGGWIKSPTWNRQKAAAAAAASPAGAAPRPPAASKAEEKSEEAAGDPEPEAVAPAAPRAPVLAEDWMVSTRESFSSRKDAEAAALLESLRMDSVAGARPTSGAPMEEKKAEESEEAAGAVATATWASASRAGAGQQPLSPTSPQSVDGISAKAFGQAEVVASKLPVVKGQGGTFVSEPECEVPTPALSSGRPGAARRPGDYSWLLSSSGSLSTDKARPVSPSGDSPPQGSHAKTPRNSNTPPPSIVGGASPSPAVKAPSVLPTDPPAAQDQSEARSAPKHAGELGQDAAARAGQQLDASGLNLPPKSQGVSGRRLLTPRGGAGMGTPRSGGGSGAGKGFGPTTPTSAAKPSRINTGNPSRGLRVSQVVEVFEGLTPKGKNGSTPGFSTPGRPDAGTPTRAAGGSFTPGEAARPVRSALAPTSPLRVESSSAHAPYPPVGGKAAPTPGALTPGAVGWSTPVATPDRAGEDVAKDQTQDPTKGPPGAGAAPEELSTGAETPGGGADRGWSTPLATPDRSPKHSAPDSGRGGATPECTTTTGPGASRAGEGKTGTGVSPTDEGQFAWQLESPAGVDGLPSPMGSSDIRVLAIGKKRGRIIPAILGASNTPVNNDGTPVLTPSTADNKAPSHRVVSSGDSSIEAESPAWEMEPAFGASQVAAFVADAKAEAAAEAQALVFEAQAEAAEEAAAEEKEKARSELGTDEAARSGQSFPAGEGLELGTSEPIPAAAAAAAASGAGGDETAGFSANVVPKLQAPAPVTAPALATIAARLSPISAARAPALQTPLPTVVATSSPITALGPALPTPEDDQLDGKGVNDDLGSGAPAPVSKPTNHESAAAVAAARAAESQATQAATAAIAAATAAAEADAAAEDALVEAKEAAMEAERAAEEAATAKAAKQRDAENAAKLVEETRLKVARQAGDIAGVGVSTTVTPNPAEGAAGTDETDANANGSTTAAARGDDEGMGVVVYSADAAWREVYNDAEADSTDADTTTDGDELVDEGEENDWDTAAIPNATPAAARFSAAISSELVDVPAQTSTMTSTAVGYGYVQREENNKVDGDVHGEALANGGAAEGVEEQDDADSLQGEAFGVDALVANAMALADAAENEAEGLTYEGSGGGGLGEQFHTATTSTSEKEHASRQGSVRDVVSSGVFGSGKSAANWNDGEETDGGDAEREAEEVQALVAEALALVKEANEDA